MVRGDLGAPNRGEMIDEYLGALSALWTEDRASFSGKYVQFQDVQQYPKPVQRPIPIFMAGTAEGVFRRLAAQGHGWIDTTQLPNEIAQSAERLRTYATEAGRTDPIAITRQMYISIADSEAVARSAFEGALAGTVSADTPNPPGIEMTLIGTPGYVRDRLLEYVAAGATELCPIFYAVNEASVMEQMELFAKEVPPALRSA